VCVKNNKISLSKTLLLVVMLLVLIVGSTVFGCVRMGGVARGWSGVTIDDGALFVGSIEGKLVALGSSDGAKFWEVPLEASASTGGFGCAQAPQVAAIYGSPVVFGELAYFSSYNGKIYAVDPGSGAIRWVYPRGGNLQSFVGGPVVSGGKVYIGCADGRLYALDAASGDKQWDFLTGDKIWSTPAVDEGTVYIGSFDNKLYALDAADGSKKWEFVTDGVIMSAPVVGDNTIYIGSFDRHVYAVDATNGKQVWQFPESDEEEGKPRKWFWANLVKHNNVIYAPCLDGKVYILDAGSGHELVEAIDLESPVSPSPVLIDDSIIIASEDGRVYSLDTASNQIKPLADVEDKVYAPLSADDGVLYIHTQEKETIYALDVQTGAELWSLSLSSK